MKKTRPDTQTAAATERDEVEAIRELEQAIQTELKRCDECRKIAEANRASAEKLFELARKGEKNLRKMLVNTRKTLRALDLPLLDGDGEPEMLCLPGMSREDAAE